VCVVLWGLCSVVRRQQQQSENVVLVEVAWDGLSREGESPVDKNIASAVTVSPSSSGPVESAVNLPGPPGKPEYFPVTDSGLVP
jgi:hypothetical protein